MFYKTFTTSYQYSEIGSLSSTDGLAEAIGSNSTVKVEWFVRNTQENNTNTPSIDSTQTDKTSSETTNPTTTPTNNSNPTDQSTDDDNFNRFNKTFNNSSFSSLSLLLFISLIFICI